MNIYISIVIVAAFGFIVSTNGQSHSLIMGSCNANNSDLLYSEVVNIKNDQPSRWFSSVGSWFGGAAPQKKVMNTTFYYPPQSMHNTRQICGIQAIDNATDGKGGQAKPSGGGLGQTWASIYFVSHPGHNIVYTVYVYALKVNDQTTTTSLPQQQPNPNAPPPMAYHPAHPQQWPAHPPPGPYRHF